MHLPITLPGRTGGGKRSAISPLLVFAFILSALAPRFAVAATSSGYNAEKCPAIWRETDELTIHRAEEVAAMDAWGKLAEYIAGMAITGFAAAEDLARAEQRQTGAISTALSRLADRDLIHYENGLVQCRLSVDVAELLSFLGNGRSREAFPDPNPAQKILTFWGNGAIAGTQAVEIVHALRAAELDASTQMLARLEGIRIGRTTTVKDFALVSDHIQIAVDGLAKNIQYTDYLISVSQVEVRASAQFTSILKLVRQFFETEDTDLCSFCDEITLNDIQEVLTVESTVEHVVSGKAAITPVLETRQPNALRAIQAARAAADAQKPEIRVTRFKHDSRNINGQKKTASRR